MKVLLKKNIRYKNKSYIAGEEVDIDENDLEAFQKADAIEEVGEDMKAKVKIKRNIEEIQEAEKNESYKEDLSTSKEDGNSKAYEDMTKVEISEILTTRGIEHSSKDLKENLIELLVGSDK